MQLKKRKSNFDRKVWFGLRVVHLFSRCFLLYHLADVAFFSFFFSVSQPDAYRFR